MGNLCGCCTDSSSDTTTTQGRNEADDERTPLINQRDSDQSYQTVKPQKHNAKVIKDIY